MKLKHVANYTILIFLACQAVMAYASSSEGEVLAQNMLGHISSKLSSGSGQDTLEGLGMSAQTVGRPSSNQVKDMGIKGKTFSSFTFYLKPRCTFETEAYGLDGSEITIPCQNETNNTVSIDVCIIEKNLKECRKTTINIPANGKIISSSGYDWQASCNRDDKRCDIKMSKAQSITGNSDNLSTQGQKSRQDDAAYQSIYDMYASKDGYNKTQSYMRSFQENGKNNWLFKCMQNVNKNIQDGIYYSCDEQQNDSMYKTTKECIKYDIKTNKVETKKHCELNPNKKEIKCTRFPGVKIQTNSVIYQNCKKLIITQGANAHCPSNYVEEVYKDMILHVIWDDVRICTQVVNSNIPECYASTFYISPDKTLPPLGGGSGILPKGLHGRLRATNVYRTFMYVTLINQSTGTTIVHSHPMQTGQSIELPYSNDQDQKFQFYIDGRTIGVLTMMVDQKGEYKTASIEENQVCAENG